MGDDYFDECLLGGDDCFAECAFGDDFRFLMKHDVGLPRVNFWSAVCRSFGDVAAPSDRTRQHQGGNVDDGLRRDDGLDALMVRVCSLTA